MVLPLKKIALRNQWSEVVTPDEPRGRVALFTGCIINHILTSVGDAVINSLLLHGLEVVIPKEQSCCGIVAMASGDEATFRSLSKKNLKLFAALDVDAIIVACATCGHTLRHQYITLLKGVSEEFHDMAKTVAERTFDISQYLVNVLGLEKPPTKRMRESASTVIATYHDPCHLRRAQKIFREQRELISATEGVTLREMSTPERCCGGGGKGNNPLPGCPPQRGQCEPWAGLRTHERIPIGITCRDESLRRLPASYAVA